MKVFVTGATGFIGSALIPELIEAGHQVVGLTRSDEGAKALTAAGAQAHRGDLEDLESLRRGAGMADGVIHAAFNHDFSKFAENCEMDRIAIETLGSVLAGSERPLVVTAGTGLIAPWRVATEEDEPESGASAFPRVSEQTAVALAGSGVRTAVVRLPQVHNRDKQGLVTFAIAIARQKGVSAYACEGNNRWPAVGLQDAARVYRLALEKLAREKGTSGARYHAVAEEGVPVREIAEAIGRGLKVPVVSMSPEEAAGHFGFLSFLVAADCPASSALTQQWLGWRPSMQPGLMEDLDHASVFAGSNLGGENGEGPPMNADERG